MNYLLDRDDSLFLRRYTCVYIFCRMLLFSEQYFISHSMTVREMHVDWNVWVEYKKLEIEEGMKK